MRFEQVAEPHVRRPIMVAAMQDMGNVGGIVVDFINDALKTRAFRTASLETPTHVIDHGGHIEMPKRSWEYRYADDIIVFGGGTGQPQGGDLALLCRDVIDTAKRYSAKFIYTAGGLGTDRALGRARRTYVTATSEELAGQVAGMGLEPTSKSVITGFNGLVLGFAKESGIRGIGMYGEIDNPQVPQFGAAAGIIRTLERLTYRKIGDAGALEAMARRRRQDFP